MVPEPTQPDRHTSQLFWAPFIVPSRQLMHVAPLVGSHCAEWPLHWHVGVAGARAGSARATGKRVVPTDPARQRQRVCPQWPNFGAGGFVPVGPLGVGAGVVGPELVQNDAVRLLRHALLGHVPLTGPCQVP